MNPFFYFMARNGKQVTRVSFHPKQIENVYVGQQRIFLKTVQGCYYVNQTPTKKERDFWISYKRRQFPPTFFPFPQLNETKDQIRWDMATPDALAISTVELYEELK